MAMRSSVAEPAVQPASSRPRAKDPDMPKEAAETIAKISPAPVRELSVGRGSGGRAVS